jgi:crotonobetainyl-CoA:carnitine CoA-transferase CaiB-like acyl-CoA transferase
MPIPEQQRDPKLKGPLAGVRIIEMGQLLAGPFTTARAADFGAEVIKIEPPVKGDPMRNWGHHRFKGRGLWWPVLGRNKKSVTANLRTEAGCDLVRELVAEADALVENFKPGTLEKWGIGPEELHAINPRLVIVRVSGFGQTGPYSPRPGFASVGEAMGGLRHINGYPGEAPPRMHISLGDTLTGMFAFQGLLMALYQRDALGGGVGQIVDASILESCFAMMEGALPEYDKTGEIRPPSGTGLANVSPSNLFPTKDGKWVIIAANFDPMFVRLCEAMGQPELAKNERYDTHLSRGHHADELDSLIADWTRTLTLVELNAVLEKHNVVVGPIYTIADIAQDPHFHARGMIQTLHSEHFGDIKVPGITPKLSKDAGKIAWLGPDKPGSHNKEIYGELLGKDDTELAALEEKGEI